MTEPTGMLELETLRRAAADGSIETVAVGFTDHYGRLLGKRFDVDYFLEVAADEGTHACDYLLTVDMEMNPVSGYQSANWDLGYGDFHLVPDMTTLRVAAWADRTALVLCDVHDQKTHELLPVAPRSILRAQVERARAAGYEVMAASELEYYSYKDSYGDAAGGGYDGLTPSSWYIQDYHLLQGLREEEFTAAARRNLKRSGVPVETSKGEWGRGQHEINVRYTDALAMADRHAVLKQCLKGTAIDQGTSVTFMAKPYEGQAGSSCHIHLSLWDENGNGFAGDGSIGESDVFRWFLAGWLQRVPELLPMYAPTVNSYKRFEDASWAPTRLAWSYDNRTAAMRIVGSGSSLRIECRLPGADCNPYLAFAAAIASGLGGIDEKTEPPPMFEGDAYKAASATTLASNLGEAGRAFAASGFARETFGAAVVDHYGHFFAEEHTAFESTVTDWERRRYFEQI